MTHLVRTDTEGRAEERLSPGGTTLGRLPTSDIVLTDRGVSRTHARVWREDGQWRIQDLESRAGVRVNGVSIAEHVLSDGDRIDVGPVRFVFAGEGNSETSWAWEVGELDVVAERSLDDVPLLRTMTGRTEAPEGTGLLALVRSAERLRSCTTVDEVADTILAIAQKATGAQRAVLMRFDEAGDELGIHLGAGPELRPSRTFVARVLEAQVGLLARDVQVDPDLATADSIAIQAVRSLLCAPLWSSEQVSGVLYMDRQEGSFNAMDLDLAVAFGHQAASEIGRLELIGKLQAELDRRRTLLRFLPHGVAEGLADDPDALAATERSVAVLSASTTGLAAGLDADTGELLDALVAVAVDDGGGTLVDAAHDGLRVLFGAPTSAGPEADVRAAADTAVRLVQEVERLRGERRAWAALRLRVGLHYASCTVGLLGPARRQEYRAVGEAVDGAEAAMRAALPGRVLATMAAWPHIAGRFQGVPRPGALVDGAPGWWVTGS